ncbi:hypothetical protein glysoja_038691 [Glycine soja]|uniref:Uncharacterized protein n=1 Tax=Glycine soja TaxID=3848 RepID=A0A0B2QZQ3_GLYSO|nr:hypothetical protein glysoja_038691 [Glycine soja]
MLKNLVNHAYSSKYRFENVLAERMKKGKAKGMEQGRR